MFHPVTRLQSVEYLFEILFLQLRGGAAAEVNGFNALSFQIRFPYLQLLAESLYVARFQFASCGRIKITIDATGLAERDVEINTCHNDVGLGFCGCKSKIIIRYIKRLFIE